MHILDTDPEESFDSVTRALARHFNVPIALVSLVDENRQWFKSRVGLDVCETDRDISFCGRAIEQDGLFVVNDTHADPRFADNPLVTGDPFIRFYAGAVLKVDGFNIGTLCIIDRKARDFDQEDERALWRMARLITRRLTISAMPERPTRLARSAAGG